MRHLLEQNIDLGLGQVPEVPILELLSINQELKVVENERGSSIWFESLLAGSTYCFTKLKKNIGLLHAFPQVCTQFVGNDAANNLSHR